VGRPQSPAEGGREFGYRRWQPGEICVKIKGAMCFPWRAVNHEGELLESYVTRTGNKAAALVLRRNRWSAKAVPRQSRPTGSGYHAQH
jgi:putative transposase